MDELELYRHMARARAFEVAVAGLWREGEIGGEMHAGTGEEAVAAGVVCQLDERDGLALTHRGSPELVVRGLPLVPMLREFLGRPDGLGGGNGGHMHIFSREHRTATSGIVGASAPAAAGFALAAKHRGDGGIGVAFTGDGAMNQGMLLETLNLAQAWSLPLLLVCIDNSWAITTRSSSVTGGELDARVHAFGWRTEHVDGTDVRAVYDVARDLVQRCRRGNGPAFLRATCARIDGHFLGDPLLEQSRNLTGAAAQDTFGRVLTSALQARGGGAVARASGLAQMVGTMARARLGASAGSKGDPLKVAARALRSRAEEREAVDVEVAAEIEAAVRAALAPAEAEVAHA
jgi:TPP-dependent pyruvate/acetoin dehydrogenase alpha subunit